MTAATSATLRSAVRGPDVRRNSLNFLRLVLALLVVVSHSWPLAGFGDTPRWGTFAVGDWAVSGFFAISGWLITSSRLSTAPVDFIWRRALRIYPAYAACLVAVGFGFAPLAAWLRHSAYSISDGASYTVRNAALLIEQWNVGTTLRGAPRPDQWNGPLWSLAFEFICYLLIGALVTVVPRRWVTSAVVAALVGFTAARVVVDLGLLGVPAPAENLFRLAPFFFAGALLYVLRDRVPWAWPVGLLCAGALVLSMATRLEVPLGALPTAYLLLWAGAVLPFTRVGRRNDISYGVYIYNGPVQQVLWILGASSLGVAGFAVMSMLLTLPFAAASWFAVERPAMHLRHWGAPIDAAFKRWARGVLPARPRGRAASTTVSAGRSGGSQSAHRSVGA